MSEIILPILHHAAFLKNIKNPQGDITTNTQENMKILSDIKKF